MSQSIPEGRQCDSRADSLDNVSLIMLGMTTSTIRALGGCHRVRASLHPPAHARSQIRLWFPPEVENPIYQRVDQAVRHPEEEEALAQEV